MHLIILLYHAYTPISLSYLFANYYKHYYYYYSDVYWVRIDKSTSMSTEVQVQIHFCQFQIWEREQSLSAM